MIIVAFHTNDPLYNAHIELLKRSAEQLGLNLDITQIEPKNWLTATAFKAQFLLDMRKKHSGSLLYVDADAFIHANPTTELSALSADIGVHYLEHQQTKQKELMSGTILLNDTQATHELLSDWVKAMAKSPDVWDQKVLQDLVANKQSNQQLKVAELSAAYTYIFDTSKTAYPELMPVIEHLQAAREIRLQKKNSAWYRQCKLFKKRPNQRLIARRHKVAELADQVGYEFPFESIK